MQSESASHRWKQSPHPSMKFAGHFDGGPLALVAAEATWEADGAEVVAVFALATVLVAPVLALVGTAAEGAADA